MLAAIRKIAWASPSPEALKTHTGTILYYGEGHANEATQAADPRSVKRWVIDAYECELMRHSEVAKDINCIGGGRGYGREKEGEAGTGSQTAYCGETEAEAKAARIWRGGRNEQIEGQIIAWLWP